MSDLFYNQSNFENQIASLQQNIAELEGELEVFNTNFETIKANWSGTEFEKAKEKLMEIGKTLEDAINNNKQQLKFLNEKNSRFAETSTRL